ncbi:unnamed protein product, partial [Mesorhabditis spiculigera]
MPGKRGGGKQPTFNQRDGIQFTKQDEPDFIKKIRAKLGYREAQIEDKFEDPDAGPSNEDDDANEFGDNGPQVVVLDPANDISREELDKELAERKKEQDDKLIAEGKIVFRKPAPKRKPDEPEPEKEATKKKRTYDDQEPAPVNKSLLSFGADEDDDE